ncbi:hypothetical protein [Tranquillimonas alkanivorans]|uniref:hypothetical protein n=1 Tax=Tranquillimonas alkanivorans TaxID=441119 RepID=UPI000B892CEC|nr:hypothetical protein [Tranquillimonas alkanivorans]
MTNERETKAGLTERARHAGDDKPAAPRKRRMSAKKKQEAVLRILRGEDLELVSREIGTTDSTGFPASKPAPADMITREFASTRGRRCFGILGGAIHHAGWRRRQRRDGPDWLSLATCSARDQPPAHSHSS